MFPDYATCIKKRPFRHNWNYYAWIVWPSKMTALLVIEYPQPFTYEYSVETLSTYRVDVAMKATELEHHHRWQRSSTFQLLLSKTVGTLYQGQRLRQLWSKFITTCLKTRNDSALVKVWWLIYGGVEVQLPAFLTSALNARESSASSAAHCFLYNWLILAGGQYVLQAGNDACRCLSGYKWNNRQTGWKIMKLVKDD